MVHENQKNGHELLVKMLIQSIRVGNLNRKLPLRKANTARLYNSMPYYQINAKAERNLCSYVKNALEHVLLTLVYTY